MICILILSLNIKLQKHLYTKHFMDSVIAPNRFFGYGSDYCETKSNYQNYLITWNNLVNKRHSRILNKQLKPIGGINLN